MVRKGFLASTLHTTAKRSPTAATSGSSVLPSPTRSMRNSGPSVTGSALALDAMSAETAVVATASFTLVLMSKIRYGRTSSVVNAEEGSRPALS
jgi:hypothetical protein